MPSYVCTVTIVNGTDPVQNANITSISGTFVYSDGTDSPFGDTPINVLNPPIPAKGQVSYSSQDKCVVEFIFYVHIKSGDDEVIKSQDTKEDNGCMVSPPEWVYTVGI